MSHTASSRYAEPAGVAAALLNQAHIAPDLVAFVGAEEAAAFDSVDGRRTMAEIGEISGLGDRVVGLFERLWRPDLVVLDASGDGNAQRSR